MVKYSDKNFEEYQEYLAWKREKQQMEDRSRDRREHSDDRDYQPDDNDNRGSGGRRDSDSRDVDNWEEEELESINRSWDEHRHGDWDGRILD